LQFVFPHNFLLEVLFISGVVGLVVFCTSVAGLSLRLWWAAYATPRNYLASTALAGALLSSSFVFLLLTLPLLSRISAYTIGICVGLGLASSAAARAAR
jgi:O-antigen ligase